MKWKKSWFFSIRRKNWVLFGDIDFIQICVCVVLFWNWIEKKIQFLFKLKVQEKLLVFKIAYELNLYKKRKKIYKRKRLTQKTLLTIFLFVFFLWIRKSKEKIVFEEKNKTLLLLLLLLLAFFIRFVPNSCWATWLD